jgi:hypothetical protein
LNELDEKPIHTNIQSFEKKGYKAKTQFKNHLVKHYVQWVQNI